MAIEWSQSYNVHRAKIGRLGDLVVNWSIDKDRKGYDVSAFGVRLVQVSPTIEEGKRRAIGLAKKLLGDAVVQLED